MATRIEKYLASGSADIDETIDLTAPNGYQILGMKVSFASNATNNLVISIAKGVTYSFSEATVSGSGVTLMSWAPSDVFVADDEQLVLAWTNPGSVDWVLRLIVEKL